jgi:tetratricopeptide (TPR) repeat protein
MVRSARIRRIGIAVLAALIVVHLIGFYLYTVHQRQVAYLSMYLDAREQWRSGRLDEAALEYRKFAEDYREVAAPLITVRSFPAPANAWFALGRIEAEQGHVDAALEHFARAMQSDPTLGRQETRELLLEQHRSAQLAALARAELARNPKSLDAWRDLAAAALDGDDPAAAAKAYRQALTALGPAPAAGALISPEAADLMDLMSVAWLKAGDQGAASAACDELAAHEAPQERQARLCAAYLAAARGDDDAARELIKHYLPARLEQDRLSDALRERLGLPK